MKMHGHVFPNPDGSKARCGGPAICDICQQELAWVENGGLPVAIAKAISQVIYDDPHHWSERPCTTCRTVITLLGGVEYGCYRHAREKREERANELARKGGVPK